MELEDDAGLCETWRGGPRAIWGLRFKKKEEHAPEAASSRASRRHDAPRTRRRHGAE